MTLETNFPELQRTSALNVNNTYSYINNTGFYSQINSTYFDYYYRVIRRCSWWVDGYVMDFHNQMNGIFSTRLAASLTKGIGNTIMGERLLFKQKTNDDTRSLQYINEWSDKTQFQEAIRKAVKYAVALGTSMIKCNKSGSELWAEPVRLDYFYFECDFREQLQEVVTLIKHYTNTLPANAKGSDGNVDNFYLVERRYFKNIQETKPRMVDGNLSGEVDKITVRKPFIEYVVKKYRGNVMSLQAYSPSIQEEMRWDSIPQSVRAMIKKDFNVIKIGEPQPLPFKNWLGCELLKFNGGDISLPQTPFGSPMIYDIISELMLYDLAFSYYARDMYLGKGIILTPKGMTQPGVETPFSGYEKSLFEMYESADPEKQKPMNVQFELRGAEWEQIQDNLLRKIATKIGMSPKTIASYLSIGQTQKTATEVDSEDDATISYIQIQRSHLIDPINRFIENVLNHSGKDGDVIAQFSTPSLVNKDKVIDRALKLYDSGVIGELELLQMVYPEESNDNLKAKAMEFEKRANEKKMATPFNLGG